MADQGSVESHGRSDSRGECFGERDSLPSRITVIDRAPNGLATLTDEQNAVQILLSQNIAHLSISEQLSGFEAPQILRQPRRHRHVRMLTDVESGRCALVQAEEKKQLRVYPETVVSSDDLRSILDDAWSCIEGTADRRWWRALAVRESCYRDWTQAPVEMCHTGSRARWLHIDDNGGWTRLFAMWCEQFRFGDGMRLLGSNAWWTNETTENVSGSLSSCSLFILDSLCRSF